jgi:uncharacterized protein (TIGR02145 family)
MRNLSLLLLLFSAVRLFAQEKIELVNFNNDWWSMTNLSVTQFRNGDEIRNAKTRDEWVECLQNGIPAYCAYKNDTTLAKKYGYMYNWFAIADPRGLAPAKTRVAHNGDYSRLYIYVNNGAVSYPGTGIVGQRLRSKEGWEIGAPGENLDSFAILPGGYRNENGEFMGLGKETALWVRDTMSYGTVSLGNAFTAPYALVHGQKSDILFQGDGRRTGCYVRLVLGEEAVFDKPKSSINENSEAEIPDESVTNDKKKRKKKN